MTVFNDDDFKEVNTYDGFGGRDKDFTAVLTEMVVQPIGKKDTLALSLKFDDDPEGEKLINIFGIDRDKDRDYNRKMSFGAFLESLLVLKITPKIAKKMKEGTNQDDPAYDYAFRTSPSIIGAKLTLHVETSKYTKDEQEKTSQTWTVIKIEGNIQASAPTPAVSNVDMIESWRQLICNPEQVKILGLPGTKKNIILNLKKIITDPKKCDEMQKVRDAAFATFVTEGLLTIEGGKITVVE